MRSQANVGCESPSGDSSPDPYEYLPSECRLFRLELKVFDEVFDELFDEFAFAAKLHFSRQHIDDGFFLLFVFCFFGLF